MQTEMNETVLSVFYIYLGLGEFCSKAHCQVYAPISWSSSFQNITDHFKLITLQVQRRC